MSVNLCLILASFYLTAILHAWPCTQLLFQCGQTQKESIRKKVEAVTNSFDGSDLYLAEDREALAKIWGSSYTPSQKAEQTFKIYLNARLRPLPPDVARFAEKTWNRSIREKMKESSRWDDLVLEAMGRGTEGLYSRQGLIFAAPYEDPTGGNSLLHYTISAHELEHAIQEGLRKHYKLSNESLGKNEKWVQTKFLMEKSAMMAENLFLTAVPESKEQILRLLESEAKKRKQSMEDFYADTRKSIGFYRFAFDLIHSNFDPKEYAKSQWNTGRYSLPAIRHMVLAEKLKALDQNLILMSYHGKNRTQPDKAYLDKWNQTIRKLKEMISKFQGKEQSTIRVSGTLSELRESLNEVEGQMVQNQKQLQELYASLQATATKAELLLMNERIQALKTGIENIRLYYQDTFE